LPKERSKNFDAKSEEAQKFELNKTTTPQELTAPYLSNPPFPSSPSSLPLTSSLPLSPSSSSSSPHLYSLPQPQSSPKPSVSVPNENDNLLDNHDKEPQSSPKSSNLKQHLSKVKKSASIHESNIDQGKVGKYFNRPHVQHSNDRGRNKKFSNRSEHKYEQNLPPRLQKKLLMDKVSDILFACLFKYKQPNHLLLLF